MAHETMETNAAVDTDATTPAEQNQARMFSQDELNDIVESRVKREQAKYSEIDVSEYKDLKAAKDKAENERLMKRNEFDKILQQQKEKHDAETTQLLRKLESIQVDGALVNAASQLKAVNPQHIAELLRNSVKLDGEGNAMVYDDEGSVKYNQETAAPYTINELVSEFVNTNPYFKAASPSGTGSASNTANTKPSSTTLELSQLDLTKAEHREIYRQMKADGKIS